MTKHRQLYNYNDKLKVKDKLFTPLAGVRLGDGLFKEVFENNINYLKTLDDGSMMYWFDKKTGTPTDAQPYTGHFEDNLKGSTLSMFLMGAGNTLRWVDDDELRRRVSVLMDKLRSSAEEDGFLMPVDQTRFAYKEYPHYVRIWLTYGLCAVALSCEDEDAYGLLRRWQDWFNSCIDLPIIKYLELAFQGVVASPYVYTTPIGKREDIDTTIEAYEEPWRLAQFMRREKDCVHIRKQPGREPHAHGTELEGFEGYLDLYRATGRNYYLDAVMGAWELYRRDWQHVGGGIVMIEGMMENLYPGCRWIDPQKKYNELCCTSFWMYLNLRLHRLFPDEEVYMDEVEKSLFNLCFAAQEADKGIRYFNNLEGRKVQPGGIHCCCGVGTRIYGSMPEFIFSIAPDAVAVNMYAPSEIDWEREDGVVTIKNEGNIPYRDDVKLTLSMAKPAKFDLRLRIPRWTAANDGVDISVNGEKVCTGRPGSYAVISREWADGDVVEYTLRQAWGITKYSGADEFPQFSRYYIQRGPVLYGITAPSVRRARQIGWSVSDFEKWITPNETPLHYDIAMHSDCELVPYYEIGCDVDFTCVPVVTD